MSISEVLTAPLYKRRCFNSEREKECTWLKHVWENSVIFCELWGYFDTKQYRNQVVQGLSQLSHKALKAQTVEEAQVLLKHLSTGFPQVVNAMVLYLYLIVQ